MKEDGKKKLCIYELTRSVPHIRSKTARRKLTRPERQIFVCNENGQRGARSLNDPLILTKEFKLPYTLRSTSAYSPRVIPVGKNLAFVTSEKTVVLIDKERKEVASFSTEA